MAQDFSPNQPQVFQCQNCREFINTAMTNCSYCGVVINLESASAAAEVQSNVGKACSDANFLKIMARALVVFFVVSFIPFVGGMAGWASLFLFLAVPVMLIRWWIKYNGIQTGDKDYEEAKKNTIISAVTWCGVVVVWFLAFVIQVFLAMQR